MKNQGTEKVSHTQGEWSIYKRIDARYTGIQCGENTIVVFGMDGEEYGVRGKTKEESEANAKRIVACVNVLSGLTDQQITILDQKDLMKVASMHDDLIDKLKGAYERIRTMEGRWENPRAEAGSISAIQYEIYKLLKQAEQK